MIYESLTAAVKVIATNTEVKKHPEFRENFDIQQIQGEARCRSLIQLENSAGSRQDASGLPRECAARNLIIKHREGWGSVTRILTDKCDARDDEKYTNPNFPLVYTV
jgi:hypothetical protein